MSESNEDKQNTTGATTGASTGYIELIRTNSRFRNLWLGQVVSLFGDWFNLIASAALISELTESKLAVGGLFVVRMLAPFLISPIAGVAADRYNRKLLLILTDLLRAVIVLGVRYPKRRPLQIGWRYPRTQRNSPIPFRIQTRRKEESMINETERLLEILEHELEAYEVLEGMIVKEREVLRHPDAEKIEELLGGKAQIVTQIHRLEGDRRRLTSDIAASQGLEGENVRLLEMLREIPAPLAGRLKEVRDRLFSKATRVNEENERNQKHIHELLSVVNGVVDTIRSAFAKPAVYGQRGKLNGTRVDGGEVLSQAV